MQAKAIEKLQSEMTKNTANTYVQVVGGFLLQHLEQNPQDAEKILVADKDIGKSLEEMRKEASKKKVGSCAVLTDQEGFAVVLKYFGIDATAQEVHPLANSERVIQPSIANLKPETTFDIKLEDLL